MPDDPVRKALNDAVTVFQAMNGVHPDKGRDRHDMAVVIAVFLRALPTDFDVREQMIPQPSGMHVQRLDRWSVVTRWNADSLAAAVERAGTQDTQNE